MVLTEGATSDRVGVVFDDCRDDSMKKAEREKRGEANSEISKPITRLTMEKIPV